MSRKKKWRVFLKGIRVFSTCTKRAPHVSHLYGFSPEWMRVWVLRFAGRLNWAPQILQRYGFSPGNTDRVQQQAHTEGVRFAGMLFTFSFTCVDGLVAGQVAFVSERGLTAVALVWLVAVYLEHVLFQRIVLRKLGVTFVTEERTVFCRREIKGKVKRLKCLDHLSGEGEAQTHHSWSRSIRSGAPTCLLTGGSWRRGDRPPSAEATGSRRWSSWGGSGSVEDLLPSPNPRVNCRQKVSSVIIFHTRWVSFLKVPEMVVKLERR